MQVNHMEKMSGCCIEKIQTAFRQKQNQNMFQSLQLDA